MVWLLEETDVAQKTTISAKESATTNLFHHQWTNYRTEYVEHEKLRQSAGQDSCSKQASVPAQKHTRQEKEPMARHKHCHQLDRERRGANSSGWERDGFKQLLNPLDPRYRPPGQCSVSVGKNNSSVHVLFTLQVIVCLKWSVILALGISMFLYCFYLNVSVNK